MEEQRTDSSPFLVKQSMKPHHITFSSGHVFTFSTYLNTDNYPHLGSTKLPCQCSISPQCDIAFMTKKLAQKDSFFSKTSESILIAILTFYL